MKKFLILTILLAPPVVSGQPVLDEYITIGLDNNLSLKQKIGEYDRSIEVLNEAKGLFYPGLSLNARYTVSEGGRVIDFPVGDLLNPAYSTLNALTASSQFLQIENQQIRFLRPTEHETKLRLVQPVFNTGIYYNMRISNQLTQIGENDVNQYRRELTAEIKTAYYNVGMADALLKMLSDMRSLLTENIRVNRKLIENGKITRDNLYRAEAELHKFDQEMLNAQKNVHVARAYFNFLLNRKSTDSIIIQQPVTYPSIIFTLESSTKSALESREEISKLENYTEIKELQTKLSQSGKLPDLAIVADYGFQGEEYKFNSESDYIQASAILSWNLFEGFSNRARIRKAVIEKEIASRELEEVKRQIELQVIEALSELSTSEKAITSAEARLKNAEEGYRLVEKMYNEGTSAMIEYIDARTNLTQASENLIISRFRYLAAFAGFEKVTGFQSTEK